MVSCILASVGASILFPCLCTVWATDPGFVALTEAPGPAPNALPRFVGVGPNKCIGNTVEDWSLEIFFASSLALIPGQFPDSLHVVCYVTKKGPDRGLQGARAPRSRGRNGIPLAFVPLAHPPRVFHASGRVGGGHGGHGCEFHGGKSGVAGWSGGSVLIPHVFGGRIG